MSKQADNKVIRLPPLGGPGGPSDNDGMELNQRVANLETGVTEVKARLDGMDKRLDGIDKRLDGVEQRLAGVETSVKVIESKLDTFATKADLHEMSSSMIKWMVGTAVGLGAAAITVMTFVLNNAAPKVPPTAPQPPIIINVPAAPVAPPVPPAKP